MSVNVFSAESVREDDDIGRIKEASLLGKYLQDGNHVIDTSFIYEDSSK